MSLKSPFILFPFMHTKLFNGKGPSLRDLLISVGCHLALGDGQAGEGEKRWPDGSLSIALHRIFIFGRVSIILERKHLIT